MIDEKTIIEDGENGQIEEVLIAPIGTFTGSDKEGNPVEQNFTEQALTQIADDLNEANKEVLLDKDHASAREGLSRDTQSLGWFSKFIVKPLKGLFGLLKLTKSGREMIENREYRHVSPVFQLDENNMPIELVSVAATNTPAIEVPENVILNSKPNEETEMTKEEIIELIKTTFAELKKADDADEKKEEVVEETKEETTEETTNECGEEVKSECTDEAKNEEPTVEEKKEEKVEEEKKEVIKEEVLNQAPATTIPSADPEWKTLKGKDFMDWCQKHPELCR
jgi:phage I-like protein